MKANMMEDIESQHDESPHEALQRLQTSQSVTMSPELFEKLYLAPLGGGVKGDLRKTFGNPTPLGLIGFVLGLTPLACNMMGWRGSGGLGAANLAVFLFVGGPCLIISGLLEFFLGNTFPFAVFICYGCVFLALGGTLTPLYGASAAYTSPAEFDASLAFFPLSMAILNTWFLICSVKINAVFFVTFIGAGLGFALLAAGLWATAEASTSAASIFVGCGASWFVTALCGWYLLLAQLLGLMGFKVQLPVGDFSRFATPKRTTNGEDLE